MRAFTERLALKATAIGLSVVLWFIITVKEPATDWVQATFRPVLDSSLVLRGGHPEFLVSVAGTPAEVARLRQRPPTIAPRIESTTPDTLVLDLRTTDVQVPEGIRVEGIDPPSVTLQFEPTWTRRVPVTTQVRVTGAEGAPRRLVGVEPGSIEISGPRLAVLRTQSVSTEPVVMAFDDSLPHLVAIDTAGLAVRPNPAQVKVWLQLRDTTARGAVNGGKGRGGARR